jgi:hypothetical protein
MATNEPIYCAVESLGCEAHVIDQEEVGIDRSSARARRATVCFMELLLRVNRYRISDAL